MADMILEYRVMPQDEDVEFEELKNAVKETVISYDKKIIIKELKEEPLGFGLKALRIKFQIDEKHGTEELEGKLSELSQVGEVSVTYMDRL